MASLIDDSGTTRFEGTITGATATLAAVLAEGADPDGTPLTGTLTIQAPAGDTALAVEVDTTGDGDFAAFIDVQDGTLEIQLSDEINGFVLIKNYAGLPAFRVGWNDGNDLFLGASDGTVGFYGHAPAAQAAAIPDAAGGAVQDAEARAALNSLLAAMRTLGLITT